MTPQVRASSRHKNLVLFVVLTAGIASGITIFSSASTVADWLQTATNGLFLPILLSLIVTFLLDPLVLFFERAQISRTSSIFLVYFILLALLGLILMLVGPPNWQSMYDALRADFPRYITRVLEYLNNLMTSLYTQFPFLENYDIAGKVSHGAQEFLGLVLLGTPRSAMRIGSLFLLVPLFSFFFLRDSQRIMRTLISLTPNRYFEMVLDIYDHVSWQLANFIRGRIMEALLIGIVVWLGLSLTDIRYAPLLGAIAGITNLVPYIGPIVGMVPGLVIALVDLGIGPQFWWIFCVYLLIGQIILDNFILIPILISRVSNLHPLWVILAIVMGGKLYGILGMIIGVPIASIIKITLIEIRHYRSSFNLSQEIMLSRRE
ncbi:AI-2E family transporter [Geopsychrobacter electrodiphilus]|uniref:AI-2E family transporter n=1 Tax=Geopsychrobacter electrodiphilus TaxID=225196 RepID=UPI000374D956|nr:AI-2E family transporter [Geopsychrobacter electrodiphilus]